MCCMIMCKACEANRLARLLVSDRTESGSPRDSSARSRDPLTTKGPDLTSRDARMV